MPCDILQATIQIRGGESPIPLPKQYPERDLGSTPAREARDVRRHTEPGSPWSSATQGNHLYDSGYTNRPVQESCSALYRKPDPTASAPSQRVPWELRRLAPVPRLR